MLFVFIFSSPSQAEVELFDWGINIDGTSYCLEGPCSYDFFSKGNLSKLSDLPPSIDYATFNLTDNYSILDGFGKLVITVTGAGPHSVSVYFNYDLDYSINNVLNETGTSNGTAPAGLSWEIDEIGWGSAKKTGTANVLYTGDIFDNFFDSGVTFPPSSYFDNEIFFDRFPLPDGQYLVPPVEDTALGQSWDFELLEGQTAVISFTAGATAPAGFYLVQQDPDTGTNTYLTSSLALESNCAGVIDCNGVCNGSAIVDDCGVCGGDNSTCLDCNGVANGTAVVDNCGTCDSDPINDCVQDCAGTWGGSATTDNCGTCDTNPANDCVQDCAGTWGGSATVDNCGVCDTNPANDCTQDCNGVFGGAAVVDACGTCDSDPANDCVQDCAGTWGGSATTDNCGTCDTNPANDCVQDCNGTWGGSAVLDNCGVCDGDNSTCTPNAIPGDLNDDGIVNMADVTILTGFLRHPVDECTECDIDGDGRITILDARKLVLLWLATKSSASVQTNTVNPADKPGPKRAL
ncbi:MAG: hypothetical protein BM485_10310 [Desulfobulbaceae bacterium DB1]|nr:MAG: hypothetical protein BM485_10310 [Desulfobulbaceae bacterium DB1]